MQITTQTATLKKDKSEIDVLIIAVQNKATYTQKRSIPAAGYLTADGKELDEVKERMLISQHTNAIKNKINSGVLAPD